MLMRKELVLIRGSGTLNNSHDSSVYTLDHVPLRLKPHENDVDLHFY